MLPATSRADEGVDVPIPPSPKKPGGPRPLAEILGDLFTARGFGRLQAAGELEAAWLASAGADVARQTKLGGVRQGILNVTVAHSSLLEDLAQFRKADLLAAIRREAPGTPIHDIRFRVGPIDDAAGPKQSGAKPRA